MQCNQLELVATVIQRIIMLVKFRTAAELKAAIIERQEVEFTLTMASLDAQQELIAELGYSVEITLGDYYRLLKGEDIVIDDSACEDYYSCETAIPSFISYLYNNGIF